jgi:hypothetical protein
MATYKVWLTVKDRYGLTKELDAGNIEIQGSPTEEDINKVKIPVYVPEVTADNMLKFKLTDEVTEEELEFDIDKTNDWNKLDQTTGSSYIWEPMQ